LSIPQSADVSTSDQTIEAIFLSLGYLMESGTKSKEEFKRITNYTVLLNVSTDPLSRWLAYDYYPTIDLDMITTVRLSQSEYFNPDYHCEDPKPTRFKKSKPSSKEGQPSNGDICRQILQASGLEANNTVHQPIGAEGVPYVLPFMARRRILQEYEYAVLPGNKSTSMEETHLQELVCSLLDTTDAGYMLYEDEQASLLSYLKVDSMATLRQKYQQTRTIERQKKNKLSTTQAEDQATRSENNDVGSNGEKDTSDISASPPRSNIGSEFDGKPATSSSATTMESRMAEPLKEADTEATANRSYSAEFDQVASEPEEQNPREEGGFLDLFEKFDVALLARDIYKWNAGGLDPKSVNDWWVMFSKHLLLPFERSNNLEICPASNHSKDLPYISIHQFQAGS